MKALLSVALMIVASVAVAEELYTPMQLASESDFPACDPQPSDEKKLLTTLRFFISRNSNVRPFAVVNGKPSLSDDLTLDLMHPEAIIAEQHGCCWISYDDRETYKATELRDRLGQNFGGFAYVKLASWDRSEDVGARKIYYSWQSYVLNSCGLPVFIMSND